MERVFQFTEARIKNLQPAPEGSSRVYYTDTRTRGFQLAVYRSGVKSFLLYRKVQRKPERIPIGRWPDLTVEEARKIADQLNGNIARGLNPAEDRRQRRLAGTFRTLWDRYLEDYARKEKRPRTIAEDQRLYRRYLAPWASRPLSNVKQQDVRRLCLKLRNENGVYASNRALALLSSMFNRALEFGWYDQNPCKGIRKFKEESRERFLTVAELPKFLQALKEEPNDDFKDFISLALVTGAREANLLSMNWSEIDFNEAVWIVPAGKAKGKKAVWIPLVKPALEILESRRAQIPGQWVFPGAVPGHHIQTFRKQWEKLRVRAEVPDVRIHDVRRTLGSWMSKAGIALPVIKSALGHADIQTTQIYTRSENPEVRKALEITAQKMLEVGNEKESHAD